MSETKTEIKATNLEFRFEDYRASDESPFELYIDGKFVGSGNNPEEIVTELLEKLETLKGIKDSLNDFLRN